MKAIFDTLEYVERALKSGFTEEQAKFQAHEFANLVNNELVTKSFLATELLQLEQRIVIKLGAMMAVGITILGIMIKF